MTRWTTTLACAASLAAIAGRLHADALIINHSNVDITQLTSAQVARAKAKLHIAYGHTSHGSQLTDGMSGLVGFANVHGKGLNFPTNFFAWNNGGTGGALDLHDYAMAGDAGYWPQWYNETTQYLGNASHSDVNVIIWSWCGQMDDEYAAGTLSNYYLLPMSSLETTYPDVVFVYMTGHTPDADSMSASLDNRTKAACQVIQDFCTAGNRVLYDFNDIEHYNPDGTYFKFVTDNCDYYATNSGSSGGNWATEWQGAHTVNVDWYNCSSAHSQPLNANQKAFAAWALWCAIAADLDRDGLPDEWEETYGNAAMFGGGTNDCDGDGATDHDEYVACTVPTNFFSRFGIASVTATNSCTVTFACTNARAYSLHCATNMLGTAWQMVGGQTNRPGQASGVMSLTDTNHADQRYYRIGVSLP